MVQKYVHPVNGFSKTDSVSMVTLYSDKALKHHSVTMTALYSDKAIKHYSGKAVTYYSINAPPR